MRADEGMNGLKTTRARLRALFGKRKLDAEMDEEMRAHIEMRTRENVQAAAADAFSDRVAGSI